MVRPPGAGAIRPAEPMVDDRHLLRSQSGIVRTTSVIPCHSGCMVSMAYRVFPEKGHLFSVEMTNRNGKHTTIAGFRDKLEADAWIVQTKRMLHGLDPTDRVEARQTRTSGR